MIQDEEQWFSLIDGFQSAALGERTWEAALEALAEVTGSRGTQLIGRRADLTVLFNIMTGIDPALQKLVIELQPLNPRPPVLERSPALKVIADWDVITPQDSYHNVFYQDVCRRWDAPFFCGTVLERQADTFVTLGLVRSGTDGYITPEQRRLFAMVAPHVRAAVRLQAALERKGTTVLTQTMDALAVPLFVCDGAGRVRTLTAAAEALVASGEALELKDGILRAVHPGETRALHDAIDAALPADRKPGPPTLRTVVIHGKRPGTAPLALDVFALPLRAGAAGSFAIAPHVLIVACGRRRVDARLAAVLGALYGLTRAETEIARELAAGRSARDIAALRGVAVGTVRAQIKTVLGKIGVRRQAELAARLNQL